MSVGAPGCVCVCVREDVPCTHAHISTSNTCDRMHAASHAAPYTSLDALAAHHTRAHRTDTLVLHCMPGVPGLTGLPHLCHQVEADRAYQVSNLEDERRQFNRFREDALKKQTDLKDSNEADERRLTEVETKLRTANLELAAERQERDRVHDKLRQEMETVMQVGYRL